MASRRPQPESVYFSIRESSVSANFKIVGLFFDASGPVQAHDLFLPSPALFVAAVMKPRFAQTGKKAPDFTEVGGGYQAFSPGAEGLAAEVPESERSFLVGLSSFRLCDQIGLFFLN